MSRSWSPAAPASSARTSSTGCSTAGIEPRIFDLRPSPYHAPARSRRSSATSLDAGALDRGDARTATRSSTSPPSPTSAIVAEHPCDAEEVNARGTLDVLEAARARRGRPGRLRQHDLGLQRLRRAARRRGDADSGCRDHLYTATKLAGEMYCTSYAELYDVRCTILRFGIPYGPRARPAAVIPIFVAQGARGRAADDRRRRPADAPLRLRRGPRRGRRRGARARGATDRIYNLSGDETVTIREIAETVARAGRRRRDRPHRRAAAATSAAPRSPASAPPRSSAGGLHAVREGVRRYVDWHRAARRRRSRPRRRTRPSRSGAGRVWRPGSRRSCCRG